MVHMTKFYNDPALDELLGDPMTQVVMRADRVDPLKLEAMLRSLAREIAGRSGASPTALVEAEGVQFGPTAVGPLPPPVDVLQNTASSCVSQHCGAP
jgi:hypothetical protein